MSLLDSPKFNFRLGTANFKNGYGHSDLPRITEQLKHGVLMYCADSWFGRLDSAQAYDFSLKHSLICGSDQFDINTKVDASFLIGDFSTVRDNLSRHVGVMGVDKISCLFLHDADVMFHDEGTFLKAISTLAKLRAEGICEEIGASLYRIDLLTEKYQYLAQLDRVQVPFSIVDQRLMKVWPLLKLTWGLEISIRSIFLQGVLSQNLSAQLAMFPKYRSLWISLHDMQRSREVSKIELIKHFLYANKIFDEVVVGVNSVKQMEELDDIACFDEDIIHRSEFLEFANHDYELILPFMW